MVLFPEEVQGMLYAITVPSLWYKLLVLVTWSWWKIKYVILRPQHLRPGRDPLALQCYQVVVATKNSHLKLGQHLFIKWNMLQGLGVLEIKPMVAGSPAWTTVKLFHLALLLQVLFLSAVKALLCSAPAGFICNIKS